MKSIAFYFLLAVFMLGLAPSATAQNEPVEEIDTTACEDLSLDSLVLIKKSKKTAELSFRLHNLGEETIWLEGKDKDTFDNLTWHAYFSGDRVLNQGDMLCGGGYFEKLPKRGRLEPGDEILVKVKVNIREMTRYNAVLIIKADGVDGLKECSEINNIQTILLK